MIKSSDFYKKAIVGDVREIFLKAVLEIVDPDLEYTGAEANTSAPFSRVQQLIDKTTDLDSRYATLEPGRWPLDGSCRGIPDDPAQLTGEVGAVSEVMSAADGSFAEPVVMSIKFSGVSILQACTVFFSADPVDGVPADFTVDIMSVGAVVFSKPYTGNAETSVTVDGFTVIDPDEIRLTITRWSLPRRRARVAEIVPGIYDSWVDDMAMSADIQQRANFSCLSIPYGTCSLRIENVSKRFEPRNREGIFRSIEERQAIPLSIGCRLEDGTVEYKPVGVYYQAGGGWRTSDNDLSISWELVDIIGLLAGREYIMPETLPETLGGWIASIVSQLGTNFRSRWHVDPSLSDLPVKATKREDVEGRTCGDLLRFACMAAGAFPRADQETGYLTAEPLWKEGGKVTLDNLTSYPTMMANEDLAVLTFHLYDGKDTDFNVSGNATSSDSTLSVDNPFIHTEQQALTAARQILSQYGGLRIETVGRGDPASEIGDVDTVWLDEGNAVNGRRIEQALTITDGFLSDCNSVLLQADGSLMFEGRAEIMADGEWMPPEGVSQVRVIIVGAGDGGQKGEDGRSRLEGGFWEAGAENNGADGQGGYIWAGVLDINPGLPIAVHIGQGGKHGRKPEQGGATTFGPHSSAEGKRYPLGYTDLASGNTYGRTGVEKPKPNTGDGGKGGEGGMDGTREVVGQEPIYNSKGEIVGYRNIYQETSRPTPGKNGKNGASGVVVVYWEEKK